MITIGDTTIGKDLQAAMNGTLGAAAPAGNLDVTITSLDPDKILLATTPTTAGSPSIVVAIAAGSSSIPTFYLQALTPTGTATIRTSATGYATDTSTITLRPSGFLLATGNLATTTFSANSTLQVVAEYLTGATPPYVSSGVRQAVRGGLSVDVSLTSSNTSVGRIVSSLNSAPIDHVTFNGGDSARSAAFDAIGAGNTVISLGMPAGFEAASTGQQITATVNNSPAITVGNLTLGKDLQAALNGTLGAPAPAGNLEVTVRSLDPGSVLLSTTPTPAPGQPAGFASITLFVGAGSSGIPSFYVQGLTDSGAPLIEITAPDYATDTSTITLRPSGFLLATANIATTTFSSNSTIALLSQYLNPVGNPTTYVASGIQQALRAGLSVDVPLASSNTSVGTIVAGVSDSTPLDHVTFNGGDVSKAAAFDPIAGGSTVISITTPPGFSTATTGQQITATVSAPPITVANTTIGKDLQVAMNGTLGAAVPAGSSVIVTIRSLDPAKVL
ncbi:MAG TPA: hypothetical protein VFB99_05310, partial [Vicinamibacterales bacterium]|nr:hypothetical protein [Vicinamibacterales bacterium]